MSGFEGSVLWQGNREFGAEDIAYIRMLIQRFPRLPRSELADTLCEHLGWLTPAGAPKTGACRKLLARLEAGGEIRLPARHHSRRPRHRRGECPFVTSTGIEGTPRCSVPIVEQRSAAFGPNSALLASLRP